MKYLEDSDLTLYHGDVREVLRELPAESVHCVVTSPPYWGLRDYSVEGQLGLEPTPDLYVENMVAVFREVWRVLRSDGTCWLNMGDSYAQGGGTKATEQELAEDAERAERSNYPTQAFAGYKGWQRASGTAVSGLKPKDLCMIPARLALALQADGWYLRSQVVWSKPNPMPESVTDRPTTSHEFVYLLAKSPRYFFDQEAVREKGVYSAEQVAQQARAHKRRAEEGRTRGKDEEVADFGNRAVRSANGAYGTGSRNLRSVWEIPTQPYPEAHFATYPEELVRRCILAGTSERGCCPECGAPWVREVEKTAVPHRPGKPGHKGRGVGSAAGMTDMSHMTRFNWKVDTIGWRSPCKCGEVARWICPHCGSKNGNASSLCPRCGSHRFSENAPGGKGEWDEHQSLKAPAKKGALPRSIPCTVLDPFFGSGTTGLVARKHGRKCIGIELNESYCRLAADRLSQLSLLAEAK